MNFRNLLLCSITAAGVMSGAAFAADLGVLSSLDVCDQLGVSGLTISSDTNCLKVSGEVSYNFAYGLWDTAEDGDTSTFQVPAGHLQWGYDWSNGVAEILNSEVEAKLNFEATADSSFGPARGTITLVADYIGNNDADVVIDEAYISIGEGTILMAGHKGSIYNTGDDAPLNWLGLFNAQAVDTGVKVTTATSTSNSIQLTHDLGNGFSLAAGFENLEGNGLAVGVLAYRGDTVSGHASIDVWDVLHDGGSLGRWDMHAGLTATVDALKVVAAFASDSENQWNALGSAEVTFDMFTIAGSVEADDSDYTGAGASLTADVSDGVKLNIGSRWADYNSETSYEVAVGAEAALAEDLTLSGAVGYVSDGDFTDTLLSYVWARLAWGPGGGFSASLIALPIALVHVSST